MADDGALLREYSQSGSDEAFGELVRKHLDLVYSTALRTLVGDEHLARDVSQTVFIDLARKAASLCRRPELAGWLYTSTCFAAANAVRRPPNRLAVHLAQAAGAGDYAKGAKFVVLFPAAT